MKSKHVQTITYLAAHIEDISGGARVIVEHVNQLSKLGYAVELWTTQKNARPYFSCKVSVKSIHANELDKLNDPDILVITDPIFLPAISTHRKNSKTFLLLQHDNDWVQTVMNVVKTNDLIMDYKSYILSGRCSVITVSKWLQQVIKSKYSINSTVIPNGIDPKLFHPARPLLQHNYPSVLVVYDPQVWKGFSNAIEALLEVKNKIPETPLIDNTYFGFSFPAIYFNRPEQRNLARIYSSATIFVSASWLEGFGLPGLEAMACGTPIITTDSGGVCEYAIPDETAILVKPNSTPDMVNSILHVLDDKELRMKLTENGLNKSTDFYWDKSIKKLEKVLIKNM
jgi:glycosyltransferase involved in cell wall biosynthesis